MTATLTPHLHELAPTTFVVPRSWAVGTPCDIDSQGVQWGDQRIQFSDLTAVAYRATKRSRNLVQRHIARSIWLTGRSETLHIALGHERFGPNRDAQLHDIYGSLTDALHTHVEPRLRSELVRRLAAGEDVWIGALRLDRHGVHNPVERRSMNWRQLPVAQVEGKDISIRAVIEAAPSVAETVPMQAANGVLLPELVAEASLLFR